MPTDTPEAWGREAVRYLTKYGASFPGSDGMVCPECLAPTFRSPHNPDCPLASLIERGQAMFKENE